MTFQKKQFEALAILEPYFRTAVKSDWCRHPGSANLRIIYDIYTSATGDKRVFNPSCQSCVLDLVRDCGKLYFADKAAREEFEQAQANVSRMALEVRDAGIDNSVRTPSKSRKPAKINDKR